MNDSIIKKNIFATVWALAIPTVIEQLLTTLMQYVDTAMVGHYSTEASAAVGLSTTFNWLLGSPLSAAGVAILVIISSALGAKDTIRAKKAFNQAHILVLTLGVIEGTLALVFAPFMPFVMQADKALYYDGSWYFAIICFPMIFRAAMTIYAMALRASGDTKTPMYVNIGANLLNIILNAVCIYPSFTVKVFFCKFEFYGIGMGAVGAGIATCISSVLAGLTLFLIVAKRQNVTYASLKPDKAILDECCRIGLPLGLTRVVTCLGYVTFSGMVSSMGTTVFAAHSFATTAETLFYIPGFGMQTAASTLSGYAKGKGDKSMYRKVTHMTVCIIAIIMTVSGGLLFAFADKIVSFFTNDTIVIKLAASALRIVSITEPLYGVLIVMQGLLNGLGYTKPQFIIESLSMWAIRILSTYIIIKLSIATLDKVWLCMVADNLFKFIFILFITLRKNNFEKSINNNIKKVTKWKSGT